MNRVDPVVPRTTPSAADDRRIHRRRTPPVPYHASPLDTLPIVAVDDRVLAANRIVSHEMDPGARSAYKILRTRLLHRMRERELGSLAVTSCASGDGKTTISVNLSISLSEEINQRVVLVDLDLRRPGLHELLGLRPKAGLSDYLSGKAQFKDVLLRPFERLIVVPTVTPMWNSSENIHAPRMQHFIDSLRSLDPGAIIVYDLPPLLASDDFLAFAPHVDGVLLVVAEGRTPRAALLEAWEMLDTDKLVGVMLNMSEARTKSYYYYPS